MSKSVVRRLLVQLSNEDLKFLFEEIFDKFLSSDLIKNYDSVCDHWSNKEVAEQVIDWLRDWLSYD